MRIDTIKTKKAVSVLALAGILIACFVGPVHAATGYPTTNDNIYKYQIVDNCLIQVSGHTLYESIVSWSELGTNVRVGNVKHVFNINITNVGTSNITLKDLTFTPILTINDNAIPNTDYYKEITNEEYFGTDFIINYARVAGYILLSPVSDWSSDGYICITPNTTLSATYFFETPARWFIDTGVKSYAKLTDITFGNPTVRTTTKVPNGASSVINQSINSNGSTLHSDLRDIFGVLSGNSSTNNNVTQDSGTLKTQSDAVHSQEAAYYTANTQAIEATGLSNYQFSTSQSNGIGAVRNDFVAIWNAMDGWTSVYIFSLTLGLALTIIRHAPSAISRRRRRSNE